MSYKEVFTNIYENFGFGSEESRSGPGSTLEETKQLREKIKNLIIQKNIKSIVDIPCGDFHWMKEIANQFESYIGGDIVDEAIRINNEKYGNEKIKFINFDLIVDKIPAADLLIVRDVIGHLPIEDGKRAIKNILQSNCKYLLSTTWAKKTETGWKKCNTGDVDRENEGVDYGRFYPVNLMAEPFNFPEPDFYLEEDVVVHNFEKGNRKVLAFWDIDKIKNGIGNKPNNFENVLNQINVLSSEERKNLIEYLSLPSKMEIKNKELTIVTGLWNIGRPGRDFSHYLEHFDRFLEIPVNMFIYIPKEYEHIVWKKRSPENTHVRVFELNDIRNNYYAPFWDKTQEIRNDPKWLNMTGEGGWLRGSPQAVLEYYNPIVQSKMFMLHDAKIMNIFNTDYFLWLDAGITNTVYEKFFTDNRVFDKITPFLQQFLFLSYPYEAVDEIHGFDYKAMNSYAKDEVKYVCRGGLFGGHKDAITQANSTYYSLLQETLNSGYMGTEESIFSIMAHLEPHIYRRYALDGNGLIVKFIQAVLNDDAKLEEIQEKKVNLFRRHVVPDNLKVSIYMLTFNFPEQVEHTIQTYLKHPKWITNTKNYLIDNSTNDEARLRNAEICKKYNFEHIITNENLGINRGRFLAAEHFDKTDADYYVFLEDDMGIHPPTQGVCRSGFNTYVPDLYDKMLKIIGGYDIDFLKLSFTEVYMDNNIQVSWYNVPQTVRTEIWPNYDKLPVSGLDPQAPRTKFDTIEVVDGLSFITGDIYYANWPTICGKEGNRKMFLETTWQRPYEQTWMSYMFQETRKGNLKPAVLLASPVNHNRISHYTPEERREN